ncbi:MAG: GNAT family N-acetyltransferase [Calothrix sp. MO_192.B10]|nr:GNAT family N-acetyltransferase [Calothrix sp. MO_192.B10]
MSECISHVNSIFQQPWWLDALSPNQWSEVSVKKNQEVVARFPYVIKKKYGLTVITQPPLTPILGPWLKPSNAKYAKQLAEQKELMTLLIEQLPKYDYLISAFHYSIENWLPFFWCNFSQTTSYTYVLENLKDLDEIWAGFRENIRREIRKAKKQVVIRTDLDIERFLEISSLTFQRQDKSFPYSSELVKRLDAACVKQEARQIFFAEDAQGRIHAAIYVIWDENSAYYLMGGGDPELRKSGATSLLMWEAIKFAAKVTKKFDFEGSMIEPIERFFRAFGGRQVPYLKVTAMSRRMKFMMAGRDMLEAMVRSSVP